MNRVYVRASVLVTMLLGLIFTVFGCGGGDTTYSLLSTSQHFVQNSSTFDNKLDIIFVVDDQPSMSSFQAELVQSFATFMQLFQSKGFDFKIAVETTSGYLAD